MKVVDAVHLFLLCCEIDKNLSEFTLRAYRSDLMQLQAFVASRKLEDIELISGSTIQEFIAELKNRLGYSNASIRRKIAVMRAFIKHLERIDVLLKNPLAKLRLTFRQERKLPLVLNQQQVEAVLAAALRTSRGSPAAVCLRNYALLELLFYSGARIGEVLKLNVEDINLDAGHTRIKGKGGRERVVFLGCAQVTEALRNYLRMRESLNCPVTALFVNNRCTRLSVHSAELIVRKCAQTAGLPIRVTPHMFRHTMATMLLENGADLRSIQEILGHSSISTTEIYTHVSADRKRRVMSEFHPRQHFTVKMTNYA